MSNAPFLPLPSQEELAAQPAAEHALHNASFIVGPGRSQIGHERAALGRADAATLGRATVTGGIRQLDGDFRPLPEPVVTGVPLAKVEDEAEDKAKEGVES
jgi:hypothetical protein